MTNITTNNLFQCRNCHCLKQTRCLLRPSLHLPRDFPYGFLGHRMWLRATAYAFT